MSDLIETANEYPLSLSPPMVTATLAGRKTMTRRSIRPQPLAWDTVKRKPFALDESPRIWSPLSDCSEDRVCPYGVVGDRLWVREAWQPGPQAFGPVRYKLDWTEKTIAKWQSPVTMPRWACRILLQVTAIRVERLNEISVEDCIAEGLRTNLREQEAVDDLREQFRELWNRLNRGIGIVYELNPWVWVISFRRIAQ
jgi:hypothetical protein